MIVLRRCTSDGVTYSNEETLCVLHMEETEAELLVEELNKNHPFYDSNEDYFDWCGIIEKKGTIDDIQDLTKQILKDEFSRNGVAKHILEGNGIVWDPT